MPIGLVSNVSSLSDLSVSCKSEDLGKDCKSIGGNGVSPVGNTGAGTTSGLNITVDYYRSKFMGYSVGDAVPLLFGVDLSVCELRDWGRYRYRESCAYGDLSMYADGCQENMGLLFEASGKGCRQIEAASSDFDWVSYVRGNRALGARETRVDLALDYRGVRSAAPFSPYEMAKVREDRAYTSASRSGRVVSSEDNGHKGCAVYFGSRSSSDGSLIRFYDKGAEQGLFDVGDDPEVWYRVEIEAHGASARCLVDEVLDKGRLDRVFFAWLKASIQVRVVQDTSVDHRERWPLADWWVSFVALADVGVRYVRRAKVPDVQRMLQWLERCVAPSLAVARDYLGDQAFDALAVYLVDGGRKRWRIRHKWMLSGVM